MTVTDEMCRLLDERGVKWTSERVSDGVLFTFAKDGRTYSVFVRDRAGLEIWSQYLTPEQAIEATLGRRKCKNVHEPPKNTTFWPAPHFKCSVCGKVHVSTDYVYFCPNCGAEVDEVGDERNDV